MGKRKSVKKSVKQTVEEALPKPFSLKDHLNIEDESEKFQVPKARVMEIAEEVQSEGPPVLISLTKRESQLRDRFESLYNEELQKRRTCQYCGDELVSIEQAITHIRLHLLMQNLDLRIARAVANDIEDQLFPQIEKQITAALTGEERSKLVARIKERRLLSDGLD